MSVDALKLENTGVKDICSRLDEAEKENEELKEEQKTKDKTQEVVEPEKADYNDVYDQLKLKFLTSTKVKIN